MEMGGGLRQCAKRKRVGGDGGYLRICRVAFEAANVIDGKCVTTVDDALIIKGG